MGIPDLTVVGTSKISQKNDVDYSLIKHYILYNNEGEILINSNLCSNLSENQLTTYISLVSKLALKIYSKCKEPNLNFLFTKIYLMNYKIIIFCHDQFFSVGMFGEKTESKYCKLYLIHLFSSMMNFINYVETNKFILKTKDKSSKIILYKIYEEFYFKYISINFTQLFISIIYSDDIFLPNIQFNNFILLDLKTKDILYNLRELENKKQPKYPPIVIDLFLELALKLERDNKTSNTSFYSDINELNSNFVKFELTSTYPRLTFIIKFLPILNGVASVHVYSQKKLSRNFNSNNAQSPPEKNVEKRSNTNISANLVEKKNYKEYEIIFSQAFKNENSFEFKYSEPKKLKDLERIIFDFITFNSETQNEVYSSQEYRCRYFNDDINREICSLVGAEINCGNKVIKQIISKVKGKLNKISKEKESNINTNRYLETSTMNTTPLVIQQNQMTKEKIIKIISTNKLENFYDLSKDRENNNEVPNQTMNLSKIEDCTNFNIKKGLEDSLRKISIISQNSSDSTQNARSIDENKIFEILDEGDSSCRRLYKNKSQLAESTGEKEKVIENTNKKWKARLIKNNPRQLILLNKINEDDKALINDNFDCESGNQLIIDFEKTTNVKKYQ